VVATAPAAVGGHHGDRSSGRYRSELTHFWIYYEIVVSLLMLASLIALYVYNFDLTPHAPLMITTNTYDADQFAPARFFMLRRNAANGRAPGAPGPGTLGRWALAEDGAGLGDVSRTLAHVNSMYVCISLYNALQGVILLLLIVRAVNLISFQPKLSLISGTLARLRAARCGRPLLSAAAATAAFAAPRLRLLPMPPRTLASDCRTPADVAAPLLPSSCNSSQLKISNPIN
jgi:hypothetical protein